MRKKIIYLIFAFSGILFFSCEKEITLDLPESEDKLVVEGIIEQGKHPYVILTKNSSYFDPVDSNTIMDMLVLDAIVTVSDGQVVDSLNLSFDIYQLPYIKYTGSEIIGEAGKTYTLNITYGGKNYSAVTSIPFPVELDSVRIKYLEQPEDSIGLVWIYFVDPDSLGNYYRGYTKTLGKDSVFVHPYKSVYDDRIANGKKIEFAITRGWDPMQGSEFFEDEDPKFPWWSFIFGEKIVVKLCSMDAEHYDFWYSTEQQMATDGNPFATPTSVRTNISGGALGIWGGYGVSVDTIIFNQDYIIY